MSRASGGSDLVGGRVMALTGGAPGAAGPPDGATPGGGALADDAASMLATATCTNPAFPEATGAAGEGTGAEVLALAPLRNTVGAGFGGAAGGGILPAATTGVASCPGGRVGGAFFGVLAAAGGGALTDAASVLWRGGALTGGDEGSVAPKTVGGALTATGPGVRVTPPGLAGTGGGLAGGRGSTGGNFGSGGGAGEPAGLMISFLWFRPAGGRSGGGALNNAGALWSSQPGGVGRTGSEGTCEGPTPPI